MTHLYSYTLTVPLTYYSYDLRDDSSEFRLGLENPLEWDEVQEIQVPYPLDDSKIFATTEKMHFCISSGFTKNLSDDGKNSYDMPDHFFDCTVSGIVALSKTKARELVEVSIVKSCKALSILMSCNNCNKQGYQPRVEPDYRQQKWQEEKYRPYEKLIDEVCQPVETVDENGNPVINIFALTAGIVEDISMSMTIFGKVDATHFFDFYHYEKSPDLSFMVDEYYAALGTEALSSKFFHLFSIIEHVEKNYADFALCKQVFDDADKQIVQECLMKLEIPKAKKNRLCSSVMGVMGRTTDLGREAKLVNILHHMGIQEFKDCGTPFTVNRSTIKELTALRNSYYHGDGNKDREEGTYIRVETAVARLMCICEKIIVYVSREIPGIPFSL